MHVTEVYNKGRILFYINKNAIINIMQSTLVESSSITTINTEQLTTKYEVTAFATRYHTEQQVGTADSWWALVYTPTTATATNVTTNAATNVSELSKSHTDNNSG